jgi:crotonobetainyl-CoA:carnitine CoA-transferase CaiB-like acyl-CoA transferase
MPVPLNGPLDDITVVSVEQALAAPFATRQLADLGARVIKVERPGAGDFARHYDGTVKGLASYFVWLNRGKQSLRLDLKSAAGRSVLYRLIDRSDVFVQNLAPGAAARIGLSAEVLRGRDERLIVCDISGYAPDGPFGDRRAYDLLIQCETGLLSVTGTPEAPAKAGISVKMLLPSPLRCTSLIKLTSPAAPPKLASFSTKPASAIPKPPCSPKMSSTSWDMNTFKPETRRARWKS